MGMACSLRYLGVFIALLCIPFAASADGMGQPATTTYEKVTVMQAHTAWEKAGNTPNPAVFVDVRTALEYASGHIPGAVNISIQSLAKRMRDVPRDGDVYVYCEAGGRASRAADMLANAGYTNIKLVPKSMRGWRAAHYPIEK